LILVQVWLKKYIYRCTQRRGWNIKWNVYNVYWLLGSMAVPIRESSINSQEAIGIWRA
jgi:hypothetical protein